MRSAAVLTILLGAVAVTAGPVSRPEPRTANIKVTKPTAVQPASQPAVATAVTAKHSAPAPTAKIIKRPTLV